jgi:hypothetical protein
MKLYILVIFLFGFSAKSISQILDSAMLQKLANTQPLPYEEPNGEPMGCGYTVECRPMHAIFYQTFFDKAEARIILSGRLIDPATADGDTIGAYSFIFLARPNGQSLENVRVLKPSYVRHAGDKHKDRFPYRTGDFSIDIKFEKSDRLYFNPPSYQPIEYDIGQLLHGSN